MKPNDPGLTAPQLEAATLVFSGLSVNAAAQHIGVDESTVRQWAKRPAWIEYMDQIRTKAAEGAIGRTTKVLDASLEDAAVGLVELAMTAKREEVRLGAIKTLLAVRGIGEHSFQHGTNEYDKLDSIELEAALEAELERLRKQRENVS